MVRACASELFKSVVSDRRQPDDHVAVALARAAQGGELVDDPR
jgi:hypothetical protein